MAQSSEPVKRTYAPRKARLQKYLCYICNKPEFAFKPHKMPIKEEKEKFIRQRKVCEVCLFKYDNQNPN